MNMNQETRCPGEIILDHSPNDRTQLNGYRPIRHELELLARFWAEAYLDIDTEMFAFGYEQFGRYYWSAREFAWSRLEAIAGAGGADLTRTALEAAKRERRRREGPLFWEFYETGDVEGYQRLYPVYPDDPGETPPPEDVLS